ncbi:calcium-activated chloride channel regulator 4A-like [Ptychodera flava]|uniref:calcium-activated chloride channel regulator 4A-like n=1 Tax=Ptychodera flava TaxID=63121 RepID=UPI00396A0750
MGNTQYSLVTIGTVFLCLSSVPFIECNICNPVRLINHGYGDVLIAIHESIPEDPLIVDKLKNIFTRASAHLHIATHQWTYFQNVTILIPKTWSNNLTEANATTERFDIANFVIDQPNPEYGDNPYTRQTRGCGEPGDFVHFTERWVTDEQYSWYYWGDPGKVTVHEWAHLRWGVFDEYPEDDDQHFYYDQNGRVEPTRCSESIVGESRDILNNYVRCNTDPDSGVMPGPGCKFFPDLEGNDAPASLMYANYLDSVIHFCHSDDSYSAGQAKHNRLARNKHNKQCHYQSIWDIMLKHDDFPNERTPFQEPLDITPSFLVVQEVDLRIVLVIDDSNSMKQNNRLDSMLQASTKYIGYTVPNNTWIGIVKFNNRASISSYLVQVDSMDTRKELIELLPRSTSSGTCIGCGLLEGVEVLEHGGNTAAGGILFLVTDGRETRGPYIKDVVDELAEKEVIVDTLALSDDADDALADLSDQTCGNSYWYSESPDSTALHDAYMDTILSRTSANVNTLVQLASYKTTIDSGDDYDNHTIIDSSIGRHTVFFIFWDLNRNPWVDVTITAPNGTIIDENSDNYLVDTRTHSIVIIIEGIAEPGHWLYHIKNTDSIDQVVEISIESKSASSTSAPLRLSSSSSSSLITESPPMVVIYADLFQGYQQVNNAKVTAIVERPSPYDAVELSLLDNGVGADITKDDGIYSAYFLDFVDAKCQRSCRYGIQVMANDEDGTAAVIGTAANSAAMPTDYSLIPEKGDPLPVGDFGRVASGGSFQVDNDVEIPSEDEDFYPPSRIVDLESPSSDYENQTITLEWTAVGDDFDQGIANHYDLRYSNTFDDILSDFENTTLVTNDDLVVGNLTSPLPAGCLETYVVLTNASGAGMTYYFAVRAVDTAGNEGAVSNIAQNTIVPTPIVDDGGLAGWEIFLICLMVVAVIAAISIVSVLIIVMRRSKKTEKGDIAETRVEGEPNQNAHAHNNPGYI